MANLLIVDDDPDIAETLSEFLRDEGHRVRVAANGAEGLRLLNDGYPDVVLLDVEMPVLDGPLMAHGMFLQDLGRERVPILFLSGVADLDHIAARIGTPYYLPKPFSLDGLLRMLARALRERAAPTYPEESGAAAGSNLT
jgi:DNA-binding response OmpR family regulator